MKFTRTITLRIAHSFLALSMLAEPCAASSVKVSKQLPSQFKLEGLEGGGTINPSDLKGKVVLLQFWASWCVGCNVVMEDLAKFSDARSSNPGFRYLPVSVDEDMESAKEFFTTKYTKIKPLMKRAYLDQGTVMSEKLGITAVPAVVLVGANGKVLLALQGHPSKQELDKLARLVDEAKSSSTKSATKSK